MGQGTRNRYRDAADDLRAFVRRHFGTLITTRTPLEAVDEWAVQYVDAAYYWGSARWKSQCLRLGLRQVQWCSLAGSVPLPRYADRMLAWDRLHHVRHYPPLPKTWLHLVALRCATAGYVAEAIALELSFACFLRHQELRGLHRSDLLLDSAESGRGPSDGVGAGLRLRMTKTGRDKWAQLDDPLVIELVAGYAADLPPEGLLFDFPPVHLNTILREVCGKLGLPTVYTMHSLRHGAASHAAMEGVPPEQIRARGRWAAEKSMQTYLQQVRSLLTIRSLPPHLVPVIPDVPALRARHLREQLAAYLRG